MAGRLSPSSLARSLGRQARIASRAMIERRVSSASSAMPNPFLRAMRGSCARSLNGRLSPSGVLGSPGTHSESGACAVVHQSRNDSGRLQERPLGMRRRPRPCSLVPLGCRSSAPEIVLRLPNGRYATLHRPAPADRSAIRERHGIRPGTAGPAARDRSAIREPPGIRPGTAGLAARSFRDSRTTRNPASGGRANAVGRPGTTWLFVTGCCHRASGRMAVP
jgi:hypothetical protein